MKLQRSRLRIISLVLFFAFMLVVFLGLHRLGLLQSVERKGPEEGDSPVAEESLTLTERNPESGSDIPAPVPANDYDTFGL